MGTNKIIRTLLFLVDTSWSMVDGGINAVNTAIGEALAEIRRILKGPPKQDVLCQVSVSGIFNPAVEIPTPEDITTYEWKGINVTHGDAKISETFKKLNEKLSADERIGAYDGTPSLAIILIASQKFDEDWETSLNNLFCNKQFGHSVRRAVVLGTETNDTYSMKDSLLKFTSYKAYDDLTDEPITNADGTYKHIDNKNAVVYQYEANKIQIAIVEASENVIYHLLGINRDLTECSISTDCRM